MNSILYLIFVNELVMIFLKTIKHFTQIIFYVRQNKIKNTMTIIVIVFFTGVFKF